MSTKKKLLRSLFVGAVLAFIHLAFTRAFSKKPSSKPARYAAIDTFVEEQMRRLCIPGAALVIVEGDKIVHQRGFGKARPGGEIPSPNTPFFIGSATKSMTALAVMQLVEAGKVELDAPVQRYLPWFRVADFQASTQITVRHLLNHTSGIPMLDGMIVLANSDSRPGASERQARSLSSLKLNHTPGVAFEYSNLNYNLLGLIIKVCSGKSYNAYIQKHIFDPLNMSRSYTTKDTAKKAGLAVGYRYWFGFPAAAHNLPIPVGSLSSGQIISSAEDMGRYLISHLNGGRCGNVQILTPEGIEELHRPAAAIHEMGLSFGSYAMGWISQEIGGDRIVSHSGIVPDYGAFMALLPEKQKGMALLFNANHAALKMTMDELGLRAAQVLAGQPPSPPRFSGALWMLRGLLLIPALQIIDVAVTLGLIRRWRRTPESRPHPGQKWGRYILLPLFPNLLAGLTLIPMLSKMRGFLMLFAPDFSWIAMLCGSFSLVWSFFRTSLVHRALGKR